MFLADFSELRKNIANKIYKEEPKKESELKRWGRAGALMATGGVVMPVGATVGGLAAGASIMGKYRQLERLKKQSYKFSTDLKLKNLHKKINKNLYKRVGTGAAIGAGLSAAGTYGLYRGGKAVINKLRPKKDDKK